MTNVLRQVNKAVEVFSTPVICPIFIGRSSERDRLHRLIGQARCGQGHVLFICGEAGIGKTRLVTEAKAYAAEQDFLLLQGNCFQGDTSYPYAPLLDILRTSVAPVPLTDKFDPIILEFARLLPELTLSLSDSLPEPLSDPEQEKRRLFAALTRFFKERASKNPVLLIIEDLHWCDAISLEFLQSLARLCATQPLLLLMTYRSDEVQPGLQHYLAQLDRARLSQELRLTPLIRTDIATMLQAMFTLGEVDQNSLLNLIYPLTEGNPFFTEEILASLVSNGELLADHGIWQRKSNTDPSHEHIPVPRSVQDAVQQRLRQLSSEARHVVTFAAVAGRRFDFAVLQQVMHCNEDELLLLIKELLAHQLVIEVSAEQFAFRHALTQQAIYTGLLARERRSLHRTLAEALEKLYATTHMFDAHLEDLAYHYFEAVTWSKALEYAQLVGEKALRLHAPHAAIEHFTHALDALSHLSEIQPSPVFRLRGQAYETLGNFERALSDYNLALEAARTAHDAMLEWQSIMAIGFLWTGRDYGQAGAWFRQASKLAEQLDNPTLCARSLNRLGNWLVNTGQTEEGLEAHHEALRLFEREQNVRGMAETLDLLGVAYGFFGDSANSVKQIGRAIELFRSLGDQRTLFSSLASRALDSAPEKILTTFSTLRTCDECIKDLQEALHLAQQTNLQSGQAFVEMVTTQVLFSFGEFGQAFIHAQEAIRIATAIEHGQWISASYGALGQLYLLMLEPTLAIAILEEGLARTQTLGSVFWTCYLSSFLAQAYIMRHEFAQAETVLKAVMPPKQQPGNASERQVIWIWGMLELAQGKPADALRIAEQLISSAPGDMQQPIPHLLSLKGEALFALKRPEEAVQILKEARTGAEQRQAPSILWHIHRSLGQVYHHLRQIELAEREWTAARAIITRLAETIEQEHLRQHFLQAALQTLSSEKPPSARKALAEKYDGLTEREIEVLRLVAQGLTDIQVAERLVISHRTVHSHLSSIYSKLGITSRSAATRYAMEHGLT